MFKTLDSRKYWVNDAEERGREFMSRLSIRSLTCLTTLVVGGVVALSTPNVRPELPWWIVAVISLGCAAITLLVTPFFARLFSKLGEFEREGVVVRVDGHAYKSLATHLEDREVYLERISEDRGRRIWLLVSAYLLSVYEFAVFLERGVATNEHSTEIRRFVGASAAETAELISEMLKLLARGDEFVQLCNEQARSLRAKLKDEPMSDELRASILASVARREFE